MVAEDFTGSFKVYIELEAEKRLSGDALFTLLDHIATTGSISQASTRAGVSYRYSWGLLQRAEKALGLKLVETQAGGAAGGGTFLTREGRDLLLQYRAFQREVSEQMKRYLPGMEVAKEPFQPNQQQDQQDLHGQPLILASTMEPVETGLLDVLEQAFYRCSGILVRHIAAGSGRALEIARGGRVDMVLSHAPELEEQFMQEGWGALQVHVMSNPFAVVGPHADPAGIGTFTGREGVAEAFQRIAAVRAPFISRADRSGTHLREQEFWKSAGVEPQGDWYVQSSGLAGNLGILRLAQGKKAYALVDRASHILSRLALRVFLLPEEKTGRYPELTNHFALTLVNPERVAAVRFTEALTFARWLQGNKAREMIQDFGMENFGKALFSVIT